jgi:nitroreductase|tara:strand:+ start:182 stop:817 length:636 start_codon:yes stop_codon:yes gene_type:complete
MDVEECILTRRSVRKFKKVKVDWEKIGTILEAGRASPSCGNVQNWMFIAVDDETKRKKISELCFQQYWMADAPIHIVICSKPQEAQRHYGIRGERLYSVQNCAAVAENMLLMAHAQGLGACWVGAFEEDRIKDVLGIVKEARPQIIIPVGYADEEPAIPSKYKLDNVVYLNKWWGRVKDINVFFGYHSAKFQSLAEKGKKALEKARKKIQR